MGKEILVPIVIPAYEPDERLLKLLENLKGPEAAGEPEDARNPDAARALEAAKGHGAAGGLEDAKGHGTAGEPGGGNAPETTRALEAAQNPEAAGEPAQPVILVDDGSGPAYREIFERAEAFVRAGGGVLLRHGKNRGKGRALKTAFTYVCNHYPEAVGVVTADSDGQHSAGCIRNVAEALADHPGRLILGVRTFDGEGVPWKSRVGNRLTSVLLGYVSGIRTRDTQTGLRGIPRDFMRKLISVRGDRFEFEMNMLLLSSPEFPVFEVPIRTIYDSKENHQTHFRAVRDSVRIYRILGWKFIKYIFSSLSSSLVDLVLFAVFCAVLTKAVGAGGLTGAAGAGTLALESGAATAAGSGALAAGTILLATVLARILSAAFNYLVNRRIVFGSRRRGAASALKYALLAAAQMTASALLVAGAVRALPQVSAVIVKACVDTMLFFLSYSIQRKYIYSRERLVKLTLIKLTLTRAHARGREEICAC